MYGICSLIPCLLFGIRSLVVGGLPGNMCGDISGWVHGVKKPLCDGEDEESAEYSPGSDWLSFFPSFPSSTCAPLFPICRFSFNLSPTFNLVRVWNGKKRAFTESPLRQTILNLPTLCPVKLFSSLPYRKARLHGKSITGTRSDGSAVDKGTMWYT